MPTKRGDEVVKALNTYGPSAVLDLCLPSSLNSITTWTGRALAPYRDPVRDSYLATTLAIYLVCNWMGNWKKIPKP